MFKFIKLKQSTYDELVRDATYRDTMDSIIQRLLNYRNRYKQNVNSNLEEKRNE
jgi:hypothetical protein